MYMPIPKSKPRVNPMQVRESQKYMFAALNLVLGTVGFGLYGLYQYVQKRARGDADEGQLVDSNRARLADGRGGGRMGGLTAALHSTAPKRVIVVGASAAGATTAAMLTKGDPSLEVIVFDENRRVTVTALMPYAQVGHRSYDLSTSGAPDSLSSPTSWTVTREAKLIPKGITAVKPDRNIVIDTDGVEHSYDALVLATGTRMDVDGCNIKGLKEANVDKHRICVSPHITRDTLQTVWEGNVVCVKVSTRAHNVKLRGEEGSALLTSKAEAKRVARRVSDMQKENEKLRGLAEESTAPQLTKSASASSSSSSLTTSWTNQHYSNAFMKANGPMLFDRSCDVSFASTVNVLWKFLHYFNKIKRMPLSVYCDEEGPCEGLGHADFTRELMKLWHTRDIPFYGNQRLVEVDILNGEATFESTKAPSASSPAIGSGAVSQIPTEAVRTRVPFKLLFLDFPRKAPSFIAEGGLSSIEADGYVAVDPNTLQHIYHKNVFAVGDCAALPTLKSYGAVFTQVPVVSHNVIQYLNYLKRLPAETAQQLAEGCYYEYPSTSSNNSSSSSSSNATPVIVGKKRSAEAAAKAKALLFAKHFPPSLSAKYDGYSSAPLIMTTWRVMWAERRYRTDEVRHVEANGYTYPHPLTMTSANATSCNSADAANDGHSASITDSGGDVRINCHKWDNTSWEGVRGLLNGIYLQLFGYEIMYWFMFMRGHWHPPTWFTPAKYPTIGEDGIDHDAIPSFDKAQK